MSVNTRPNATPPGVPSDGVPDAPLEPTIPELASQTIPELAAQTGSADGATSDNSAAQATRVETILKRMLVDGESFWIVAYEPFIARDLRRDELRVLIVKGLEQTRGSYRALTRLFNMKADDYRRFLNFLRRHDCLPPFQTFRHGSTPRRKYRATGSRPRK